MTLEITIKGTGMKDFDEAEDMGKIKKGDTITINNVNYKLEAFHIVRGENKDHYLLQNLLENNQEWTYSYKKT